MKKIIIILFTILALTQFSQAETINVASPYGVTQVNTAIAAASAGDIVFIASATVDWSDGYVDINKNITLQGNGIENTIVTCNRTNAECVHASGTFRITGIRFTSSANTTDFMYAGSGCNAWRIDHCKFDLTAGSGRIVQSIKILGSSGAQGFGLFDANVLVDVRTPLLYGSACAMTGNTEWANALGSGSANALYIENNTISNGGYGYNTIPDGNCGARIVYRYNTMNGYGTALHGVQGDNNRGTRLFEIYNNIYSSNGYTTLHPIWLRSGTGVVFNNSIGDGFSSNYIYLDNQRSCSTTPYCDGTNAMDGNRVGGNGYPCRDQIGRSTDASQWTAGNIPSQALNPAYFWGNLHDSSDVGGHPSATECSNEHDKHIIENRDYYLYNGSFNGSSGIGVGLIANRPESCTTNGDESGGGVGYWATDENKLYRCTETNTWTLHYAPYTCPHPLADPTASLECDSASQGAGVEGGYGLAKDETYYNVTLSITGSGTLSPGATQSVISGGNGSAITATPTNDAWKFMGWSGTCGCTGTGTCTATNVTGNCTVISTFESVKLLN